MELVVIALLCVVCAGASAFFSVSFGLIIRWLHTWSVDSELEKIKKRLLSVENSEKGNKSVEIKANRAARINQAVGEAAQAYINAKEKGEKIDYVQFGVNMLAQYPDVALELPKIISKFQKALPTEDL